MSPGQGNRPPADSPRARGFRMPGEWAPHRATWIAWPHERSDWPGRFARIPPVYVEIVRALGRGEAVELVVEPGQESVVRRRLERADVPLAPVRFHAWPTDRSWVRDAGPTCVTAPAAGGRPGDRGWITWRFNAWAKYANWHQDVRLAGRIARAAGGPSWAPRLGRRRIVLEGGAIDANGSGLLLTTEECLLSPVQARNSGVGRTALEGVFARYLGVERVLWLPRGIAGDDTHGHVDDAARFVAPTTVVAAVEPDRGDPNYGPLAENRSALDPGPHGGAPRLRVVELPMPPPIRFRGERLPASYANFYIANASVLVPTFDVPTDEGALAILRREFPGRRVVGVPCRDLVLGLGTLHCLTQPEFAVPGR